MEQSTNNILQFFRLGLINGFITKSDVISWVDKEIELNPDISNELIDISLSGSKSKNDFIDSVTSLTGYNLTETAAKLFLGTLYNKYINKEISLESLSSSLNYISKYEPLNEQENIKLWMLEDELELAKKQIWGTVEQVEKNILAFLTPYKEYKLLTKNDNSA